MINAIIRFFMRKFCLTQSQNSWVCRYSRPALLFKARSSGELCSVLLSHQVLSITKNEGSRTAAGNMFQCSTTATNKCFKLERNSLYFSLCPFPLVLSWNTTEGSLALYSWLSSSLPSQEGHTGKIPLRLLSWDWAVIALSAPPSMTSAPRSEPSLWFFTGLTAVCPCL